MAITKATASAVAPAAKGDLVVGSATNDAAVLGVGTNGQYLQADSSTTTGLKWGDVSAGGMTLLSTTSLSGSTVTLSSISQSYNTLILHILNCNAGADFIPYVNINGGNDTDTILTLNRNGATSQTLNNNALRITDLNNGRIEVSQSWASQNSWTITIYNYTNTSYYKPWSVCGGFGFDPYNGNPDNITGVIGGGQYKSTSAISSLDIVCAYSSFTAGQALLYGVK